MRTLAFVMQMDTVATSRVLVNYSIMCCVPGVGLQGADSPAAVLPFLALTDRYPIILKEFVHFEQLPPR